jgi:hypothetical protein
MKFDGETFDAALDRERLAGQLGRVKKFTLEDRHGTFVTLAEIAQAARCSEASASARLRDLRKPRFGALTVERRRVPGVRGLHEYRVLRPRPPAPEQLKMLTKDLR